MAQLEQGVYVNTCSDCGGSNLAVMYREAELVCTDCGLVLQAHMMDFRSEWNNYRDEGDHTGPDPSRVGAPTVEVKGRQVGLGLNIGRAPPAAAAGGGCSQGFVDRLKRAQLWSTSAKDRDVFRDRDLIQGITEMMTLPPCVTDVAFALFNDYLEVIKKTPRGANREGILGACIYFGCRAMPGIVRSIEEVRFYCNIDKKHITKSTTHIQKTMFRSKHKDLFRGVAGSVTDTVTRKVEMLLLPQKQSFPVVRECRKIMQQLQDRKVTANKHPEKFLAAVMWLALDKLNITNVPKEKIQDICNVTDATFMKHIDFVKVSLS